jgi:pimeloyl-ACP methyl ester carboxylesterase
VVGTPPGLTADLPEKIPFKQGSLTIFEDRVVPDVLWWAEEFGFSYAAQEKPAPLVFIIAGTGAAHDGTTTQKLAKAYYQAGFHVIGVSSPTHPNFVVSASRTSVPGHVFGDAEDLYRAMKRIWETLEDKLEVTDFFLTGYSLGAFNAAFLTRLDDEKQVFKFKKTLLINPPVRLYSSISLLDRMLQNIPGGIDNFSSFYRTLVEAFTRVYKRTDRLVFDDEFLYKAFQELQFEDEQLAALIGAAFRMFASNMAFTSDVMTDFGYIKPKNLRLTKNTDLTKYDEVSVRLGFTDYFHEYFFPYFRAKDPTLTREGLIEQMSLKTIEDYLQGAEKIEVMHNADDLILEPGEIEFFPRVFGDRAKIYPRGGHMGNLEYRDNVAHMIGVFKK